MIPYLLFFNFIRKVKLLEDSLLYEPPSSDVIGLDWSWIGDSIQSNPELGHFLIWSSDCLARFSSGAKRLIQLERSNPIQNGLQSNNITGAALGVHLYPPVIRLRYL